MTLTRASILANLREKLARGRPIIGGGAGRAAASDCRTVTRWSAFTPAITLTFPSGHSTVSESTVSRVPSPNVST